MDDYKAVKEKIDILKYIEHETQTPAKKEGTIFRINPCPFCGHNDCFSIHPETKSFTCYSCGAGGTIIDFVMMRYKIDKLDALKKLSLMVGHPLPGSRPGKETGERTGDTVDVYNECLSYYQKILFESRQTLDYLNNTRRLSPETIKYFGIGLSDGRFHEYALKNGFSREKLIASGLVKEENGALKDYFMKSVLVIPHFMDTEHARIGDVTCRHPHDRKIQYRLKKENRRDDCHFFNQAASHGDSLILVEGEFDLMTVSGLGGHPNVIATCGQISDAQIQWLVKWMGTIGNKRIYLCFDNDEPGKKFTRKVVNALRKYCLSERLIQTNLSFIRKLPAMVEDLQSLVLKEQALKTPMVKLFSVHFHHQYKDIDDLLRAHPAPAGHMAALISGARPILRPIKEQLACLREWHNEMGLRVSPDEIGETLYSYYLLLVGNFFVEGKEVKFYFKGVPYAINGDNDFTSFLYRQTGINFASNQTKQILMAFKALAYDQGRGTILPGWIHRDIKTNAIYFPLCNEHHEIVKLLPGSIEILSNGANVDKVLLAESFKTKPITYIPDVDIKAAMRRFKKVFMDNLTCKPTDKFMIACFAVNTLMTPFISSKGIWKFFGSSASGKSSAARLISWLIFGADHVSSSTAAANYSEGRSAPFIIEDNLEGVRMDSNMGKFLLLAATGATRQKRKSGTDSENVYETLLSQVIVTAIEPFTQGELINRTIDIHFLSRHRNPDYPGTSEVGRQILEARDMIWSAFIKIIVHHVLPNFQERRLETARMVQKTYPNHSKNRLDELYSCLFILCEELVKYIQLPDGNTRTPGIYNSAPQILKEWIKTQDTLANEDTQETNELLNYLEFFAGELERRNPDEFINLHKFKGAPLFAHDDPSEQTGVTLLASSRELLSAIDRVAKDHGRKSPYNTARALTNRLQDGLEVLTAAGWQVTQHAVKIMGNNKHQFIKLF